MVEVLNLVIAVVATYGIATVISQYDAPAGLLIRLRSIKYLQSFLSCAVCLSVWIAIPIAIYSDLNIIKYFATIGFVIVIERLT